MDEILKKTLLIDYYGMFITDKQREMYTMRYEEDMSLAEIADEFSISRQAVSENINNADKIMEEYETKLRLIAKQNTINDCIDRLNKKIIDDEETNLDTKELKKIKTLLESM